MKSFKEFTTKLFETTVPPELQHIPKSWKHHSEVNPETKAKIEKAVGVQGHTMFPLDISSQVDTDPDVLEHLGNHGYEIKDYIKGIASTKKTVGNPEVGFKEKNVDERIGSVLEKTNAPLHVKSAFMNDPHRQATKTSGHHVLITTTPMGIAGMTTGTSWRNQSCMNMQGGGYHRHLEDDSVHGSHVAYLVGANDAGAKHGEPDNPLARIVLKPYHADSNPKDDTIFRSEDKVYGAASSHFKHAVDTWASKNYPADASKTYHKNNYVYDDNGVDVLKHFSKEDIEKQIDENQYISDARMLDSNNISHAIKYGIESLKDKPAHLHKFLKSMAEVPNLNNKHVIDIGRASNALSDGFSHDVKSRLAYRHGDKLSTNAIEQHAKDVGVEHLPSRVLMSNKLPEHIIDKLPISSYDYLREDKIKPQHIDKVASEMAQGTREADFVGAKYINRFTKSNLNDVIEKNPGKAFRYMRSVAEHPEFNQDMHNKLLQATRDVKVIKGSISDLMFHSKFAKVSDMTPGNTTQPESFMANKNLHPSEEKNVKDYMLGHKEDFMTIPENISKHMTDEDYHTAAAKHLTFRNAEHGNKYMDAIKQNIHKADDAITHFHETSTEHPDFTRGLVNDLHSNLKHHLEVYADAIDNHLGAHVRRYDDEGEPISANDRELHNLKDRIDDLQDLKHYNIYDNSDQQRHYNRNFGSIVRNMNELN